MFQRVAQLAALPTKSTADAVLAAGRAMSRSGGGFFGGFYAIALAGCGGGGSSSTTTDNTVTNPVVLTGSAAKHFILSADVAKAGGINAGIVNSSNKITYHIEDGSTATAAQLEIAMDNSTNSENSVRSVLAPFMSGLSTTSSWSDIAAKLLVFNAAQATAIKASIARISASTGVQFEEVSTREAATVNIWYADMATGRSGVAYIPAPAGTPILGFHQDVFLSKSSVTGAVTTRGEHASHVVTHEIAHALGLDHPNNYSSKANLPYTNIGTSAVMDHTGNTIMSYNQFTYESGSKKLYIDELRGLDISAIRDIWTASGLTLAEVNKGNTTYDFAAEYAKYAMFSIFDTSGTDTVTVAKWADASTKGVYLDFHNLVFGTIENAEVVSFDGSTTGSVPTQYSRMENSFALGTEFENATGSSLSDLLVGNAAVNNISAGSGNDIVISGWAGTGNQSTGGAGNDVLATSNIKTTDILAVRGAIDTKNKNTALATSKLWENTDAFEWLTPLETALGASKTLVDASTATGATATTYDTSVSAGAGTDLISLSSRKEKATGGAGLDVFVFTALNSGTSGNDLISDFSASDDLLYFSSATGVSAAAQLSWKSVDATTSSLIHTDSLGTESTVADFTGTFSSIGDYVLFA